MFKRLLGICLGWSLSAFAQADSVAFIGDSISTGGGAHPALAYDVKRLQEVFGDRVALTPDAAYFEALKDWGLGAPAVPPRRLEMAAREFVHPLTWVYERALHFVSHRYMDAEEYSWSYLLARKQQVASEKILIAARDGERAQDAIRQVDRLLDANQGLAVRDLFVFFTGNDLCAADISLATPAELYVRGIEQAVRYYARNAKTGEGVYNIWLVDPLGLLQVVSAPDILNHKVPAFDGEVSCRDLQAGRVKPPQKPWTDPNISPADIFLNVFGQGPSNYCRSLFAVHHAPAELQMQISTLLKSYREGLTQLTDTLQILPTQFRVRHLQSPGTVQFAGADMANDCFHLNLQGHLKIARAVDEEMQKINTP